MRSTPFRQKGRMEVTILSVVIMEEPSNGQQLNDAQQRDSV